MGRFVVLFFLVLLQPSLSESAIYTAYPGAERPDEEVAILELANVDWIRIANGRRIEKSQYDQIELLPGTHHIEWCTSFGVSFLVNPRMTAAYVAREELEIEPNHVYVVDADRSYGSPSSAFFWIEDGESHVVVAGFKKPGRLLPDQINPRSYTPPIPVELLYGKAGREGVYSKSKDIQMFFEAALEGDRETVTELLSAGVDLDARDRDGATALIRAAIENRPDSVDLLMNLGADVNARLNGEGGFTSLIIAASKGYAEVARLLLQSPEIDVNASSNGLSALGFAIEADEPAVRDLLLAHPNCDESVGAEIRKKNERVLALAENVQAAELPGLLHDTLGLHLRIAYEFNEPEAYCQALKTFIKRVEAKKGKKIDLDDADAWVSEAESIMEVPCATPEP